MTQAAKIPRPSDDDQKKDELSSGEAGFENQNDQPALSSAPTSMVASLRQQNASDFQSWLDKVSIEHLVSPQLPPRKKPEATVTEIRKFLEENAYHDSALFSGEEILRGILEKRGQRLPLGMTIIGGRSVETPDSPLIRADVHSPEGNALVYSGLPSLRHGKAQATSFPTSRESAVIYDDAKNGEMALVLTHALSDFPDDIEAAKLSAVAASLDFLIGQDPKENKLRPEQVVEDLNALLVELSEHPNLGLGEMEGIALSFVRLSNDNVLEIVERGSNMVLVLAPDGRLVNWQRKYVDLIADDYEKIDGKPVSEAKRRNVYDKLLKHPPAINTPYRIPVEPGTRVFALPGSTSQILENQFLADMGDKVNEEGFDFNERFQRYVATYVVPQGNTLQEQAEGVLEHQRGSQQLQPNGEKMVTSYTVAALEVPKKA